MLGSFSQNKKPTLICCFFAFVAVSETDYFLSRDLSNAIKRLLHCIRSQELLIAKDGKKYVKMQLLTLLLSDSEWQKTWA